MIHSERLLTQYIELKKEAPDLLLLMQVGVFMQINGPDAEKAAQLAGLKLTLAGEPGHPQLWCGFPLSGLDKYVGKFLRNQVSVAIAFQKPDKSRAITECIRLA